MAAMWLIRSIFCCVLFTEIAAFWETFNATKDVSYLIRSRAHPTFNYYTYSDILSFSSSTDDFAYNKQSIFDPSLPTRIFVHGYYSELDLIDTYARAYLDRGDFNFIAVNWLSGAVFWNYARARHRVRQVGEALAAVIDHLVGMGMNLEDLILVGHSLGAHVCGWAGKTVTSGKLPVIIGLDPARPLILLSKPKHRLAHTDAKYVQIIHTNGGILGIHHAIGHADFYPNYGSYQPGCTGLLSSVCSHSRVHDLFQESLRRPFWAKKCSSFEDIENQSCTEIGRAKMGGDMDDMDGARGIYYLETFGRYPYVSFDNDIPDLF